MCFSIKLVVCRDSQKGRDLGYEKGQTQNTSYRSIVKSLMPQGVEFSAGQPKLKKKKKDEKDSAPKLSFFHQPGLTVVLMTYDILYIW